MDDLKDLNIEVSIPTVSSVWDSKEEYLKQEKISLEIWDKMSDDERQKALDVVSDTLKRLDEKLELWVPHSLGFKSGTYMDVSFRLLFTDDEKYLQHLRNQKEDDTQGSIVQPN